MDCSCSRGGNARFCECRASTPGLGISRTWTHNGFVVTPVRGTYRRAAGGHCVDVRSSDPRTTVTYWTANAAEVLNERNYSYVEGAGAHSVEG